ncbi:dicarboxylate/amino acid:cation symporter [Legionella dresdenensis]|uniref:Dicarboxylate/amino acid:cation symporter n=1 Tax=Legionella dresdenensis TaxID=450200 RepID=A0ABV8CBG0_9GAMM
MRLYKTISAYFFPALLVLSILAGGLAGILLGPSVKLLKPFGDIFLNLIFTAIVPLVFFSVSSAVAKAGKLGKLGKITAAMAMVILFTNTVAAGYAIFVVKMFSPAPETFLPVEQVTSLDSANIGKQIVSIFTVSDFSRLLSHQNMMALILFSILVGLATLGIGNKSKAFNDFLESGEEVFMRLFALIMYYAPIGFFSYFAVLVNELGPQLINGYAKIALVYYLSGLFYFGAILSFFCYLAGKIPAVRTFWKHNLLPIVTSLATCSSAASIPANLAAAKSMDISREIAETVIPLGTVINKNGSVMGGIFKIVFLFGIYHFDFSGTTVLLTALGVSLLVGTVMGAIPGGGMLGELLILHVYGFPSSVLIAVAAISIIIDPLATMINVLGNTVAALMTARLVDGRIQPS